MFGSIFLQRKLIVMAVLCCCCNSSRENPAERVAPPLPISGDPTPPPDLMDGSVTDGGRDADDAQSADTSGRPARDGGATAADEAVPRPSPARAVELAAEADAAGESGELARAAALYSTAVAAQPDEPWLRVARAWYLSRLGREMPAREELEQALDRVGPQAQLATAAAHHGLGELHGARRDFARAREAYRMGLRSWSGPPLARALMAITPATSLQLEEIERIAYGDSAQLVRSIGLVHGPRRSEVLAAVDLGEGLTASVVGTWSVKASELPVGATYRLVLSGGATTGSKAPDAGVLANGVALGEMSPLRWHEASCRVVPLGAGKSGVFVTLEGTSPGVGAPLEATSVLVEIRDGTPVKLLALAAGAEGEAPFGCRRGWREEVTFESPGEGDGAPVIKASKVFFVRERMPLPEGLCPAEERRQPPRSIPFTAASAPPALPVAPDAG